MPKFKVGDKFKVVYSSSISDNIVENSIHKIVSSNSPDRLHSAQYYQSNTHWYLEETTIDNQLIISGSDRVIAVLIKIEEPDT